ncbi:MAG: TIGR00282 family metallophosphoesterase [Rectinema sp.]
MSVTIVFLGEIVGKTGVFTVKNTMPEIRERFNPDFIFANADSATGGAGLGVQHAVYLRKLGLDGITMGEASYYKPDMTEFYPKAGWVLRPANLPEGDPGRGWRVFQKEGKRVALIALLGQSGFARVHADNPFFALDQLSHFLRRDTACLLVDFHAATTAEKLSLARHADGKVSAILGTGGKVLTNDARILQKKTAAITDLGRTGSILSVGGLDPETKVREFLTGVPAWSKDASAQPEAQGVCVQLDDDGLALSIEAFRIRGKEVADEGNSDSKRD